jgi:transposase InsO family protein
MLRKRPPPRLLPALAAAETTRTVTANRVNHVWHVDLTTVSTTAGFWCSWLPFALPQSWPFAWWLALIVDHYSRRVMGFALFPQEPTSEALRAFLGRTIATTRTRPKYLICDKGPQFWCDGFNSWCRRKGIRPRFGAVGKQGSIAVIERAILTTKQLVGLLPVLPYSRDSIRHELSAIFLWYNEHRPNMALAGRTPQEVYSQLKPANALPRWEPRPDWPRAATCAGPRTLVKGRPGVRLALQVEFHDGRRHLPIVQLRRAA